MGNGFSGDFANVLLGQRHLGVTNAIKTGLDLREIDIAILWNG